MALNRKYKPTKQVHEHEYENIYDKTQDKINIFNTYIIHVLFNI